MKSVELFTGTGGLALGCEIVGFEPLVLIEWDKFACDTIRKNQQRNYPLLMNWNLQQTDVRLFDWDVIQQDIDLIAAGPPCQPFSIGGKHQAYSDRRDMFPATVEVIRKLKPRAFIIENVKGITRSSFANYFNYIQLQLEFPQLPPYPHEHWNNHLKRLQEEKTSNKNKGRGFNYNLIPTLINAADYGVPQKRERVFLVGFRDDLDIEWSFPEATHSHDALLYEQWISGDYWHRHNISAPDIPKNLISKIEKLKKNKNPPSTLPWKTVRDAICDLPDPLSNTDASITNHQFQNGAKAYPGHTGSPLDAPAKTLKAGDHGVPGGENMMIKDDGSVRYFTVRESARIQTFPDGFIFNGSWTESMRQLGNAVPVVLAKCVAASVAKKLLLSKFNSLKASSFYKGRMAA